jgi:hypothetical protein
LQSAQIFPLFYYGTKQQKKTGIRKFKNKNIDFLLSFFFSMPLTLLLFNPPTHSSHPKLGDE